jgi:hypothetical protein
MDVLPGGAVRTNKVNSHATPKPLEAPKEHVDVYLSVLGGMVQKRYVAQEGSRASSVAAFAAVASPVTLRKAGLAVARKGGLDDCFDDSGFDDGGLDDSPLDDCGFDDCRIDDCRLEDRYYGPAKRASRRAASPFSLDWYVLIGRRPQGDDRARPGFLCIS